MTEDKKLPKLVRFLVIQETIEQKIAEDDITPYTMDELNEILHDLSELAANDKQLSHRMLDVLNRISATWQSEIELNLEAYHDLLTGLKIGQNNSIISHLIKT